MKKILCLAVALTASIAGYAFAAPADTHSSAVASGVIGTSSKAYRVKGYTFRCNTILDQYNAGVTGAMGKPCYGVLRNGPGSTNAILLHVGPTSVTAPVETRDFTNMNQTSDDWSLTGVLFSGGIYYGEVTGSAVLEIDYAPRN